MDLPTKKRPSTFTIANILEDHCQKSNESGFSSDEEENLQFIERNPEKISSTVQQQTKYGKKIPYVGSVGGIGRGMWGV